ncbi:MAG: two-component regulator propeller domain-containing protein [Bacteroidota bacterium]
MIQSYRFSRLLSMLLLSLPFMLSAQGSEWGLYTNSFTFHQDQFQERVLLGGNTVTAFAKDAKGMLYFGVPGRGLVRYDGAAYSTLTDKNTKALNRNIRALGVDRQDRLWIGTNKGLVIYDGESFTEYTKDNTPDFPYKSIHEIYVDLKGRVWVSGFANEIGLKGVKLNGGGWSMFAGGAWTHYNKDNTELDYDFVEDFCMDRKGNMWVSVGIEDRGVARFDGSAWTFFTKDNTALPNNKVRAIAAGPDGSVYFGTAKGLVEFDGSKWAVTTLTQKFGISALDKLQDLDQPDVLSMAIEDNGTFWIGTKGKGVIQLQGPKRKVISIENSPITSNFVKKIHVDSEGRKYFITGFKAESLLDASMEESTSSGHVGVVSFMEGKLEAGDGFSLFNTQTSEMPSDVFNKMKLGPDGKLWMVDGSNTITSFDGENWERYESNTSALSGLFSLAVDQEGTVYAGAQNAGLQKLANGSFTTYNKKNSEVGNQVIHLTTTPDGTVWFASFKGVSSFDGNSVKTYDKKSAGLPANVVISLTSASDGSVWIGMQKGVGRFKDGSWTFWNKKNSELPGNFIDQIAEDSEGKIWVLTRGNKVGVFDGSKWTSFKEMAGETYGLTTITTDEAGRVFIGTNLRGLLVYENGKWERWGKENSPLYLPNVKAIAASNGVLWASIAVPDRLTTPGTPTGAPAATPTPEEALRAKIEAFDPSGVLVRYQF